MKSIEEGKRLMEAQKLCLSGSRTDEETRETAHKIDKSISPDDAGHRGRG